MISATGKFKGVFQQNGVTAQVVVPLHNQLVNGRLLPKVDISKFQVNFDSSKISISLSGGILAAIANIFVQIFKSTIIHLISGKINSSLGPQLNNEIHAAILA